MCVSCLELFLAWSPVQHMSAVQNRGDRSAQGAADPKSGSQGGEKPLGPAVPTGFGSLGLTDGQCHQN